MWTRVLHWRPISWLCSFNPFNELCRSTSKWDGSCHNHCINSTSLVMVYVLLSGSTTSVVEPCRLVTFKAWIHLKSSLRNTSRSIPAFNWHFVVSRNLPSSSAFIVSSWLSFTSAWCILNIAHAMWHRTSSSELVLANASCSSVPSLVSLVTKTTSIQH